MLHLLEKHLVTDQLVLTVGYDTACLSDAKRRQLYSEPISTDHYGRQVERRTRVHQPRSSDFLGKNYCLSDDEALLTSGQSESAGSPHVCGGKSHHRRKQGLRVCVKCATRPVYRLRCCAP